jgi:hypothetical protein
MPTKSLIPTGVVAMVLWAVGFAVVAYVLENYR